MKRRTEVAHKFVEHIPDDLQEGIVYVSVRFATALHKCCCGCGNQVVTPLSPVDWRLIFDGESISLYPSVGNWSFPCQSHYWIKRNKVLWDRKWSRREIRRARANDLLGKQAYFDGKQASTARDTVCDGYDESERGFWTKIKRWWSATH